MERQTPPTPEIKDEAARKPKRAISHLQFGGEEDSSLSFRFVRSVPFSLGTVIGAGNEQ